MMHDHRLTSGIRLKKVCLLTLTALFLSVIMITAGAACVHAKVKLSKTTVYLAKKDTEKLKVTGTKSKIKWTTANKKIATVSSKGVVTAKKTGTTTVTAKAGSKKLKCKVIVENSSVNRARRLRDYIISKGKYDKGSKTYELEVKDIDDEDQTETVCTITAFKKETKLDFRMEIRPDAPSSTTRVTMTIDLISGNKKTRNGSCTWYYNYPDDYIDRHITGNVTTAYTGRLSEDGGAAGLTLLNYTYLETYEDPETYEQVEEYSTVSDGEQLAGQTATLLSGINNAFERFDSLFGNTKALKNYGISMKTIGFSKWNPEVPQD